MVKFVLAYIFITIMIVSCKAKENNLECDKFKKGRFRYHGYTIERDESIQTEKGDNGEIITKRIKWINDCEYELTFLSGRQNDTLPNGGEVVYERKEKIQNIKIVETAMDFYVFETVTSKGEIVRDKVWLSGIGGFKSIGETFPVKK